MRPILSFFVLLILVGNTALCATSAIHSGEKIAFAEPEATVRNLKCDQLAGPLAIDNPEPGLSWQMTAELPGKRQTAYQILVAGSLDLLRQNKGDYWNSGKVYSARSVQIRYQGKPLASGAKLYWKVKVWDEKDKPLGWSSTASWSMGLLNASDWKAKWIGATQEDVYPDSAITFPSPYFRKEFSTSKKIRKAIAYISGLGFYELRINGRKIGDQVLAPAVTNYDKRPLKKLLYPYDDQSAQRIFYNCFDITDDLLRGNSGKAGTSARNNVIGILLGNGWYNQRDRTIEGKMWYGLPRLIFQLELTYTDGSKQTIVSDPTWKTTTGPLLKDGIFSGEKYDARLDLGAWDKPGYRDNQWHQAVQVRPPSGRLQAQTAPFDKVIRTLQPVFEGRKDSVYRYHLDETVSGWAVVRVKGPAGSSLKIRYISEEGEDYGQQDVYILKGGATERWSPRFTWHAFRKIEIIAKGVSLDQESLVIEDVHTAAEGNGTFECSNPFFNKIYSAYLRTQRANFHGSLSSDCPHRERLGYTGDGQVIMESSMYAFDLFGFYRKWLDDIDDARNRKTGFVTHTAPFGGGGGGPAWGSAYVIMPWLYFNYYGDTTLLQKHYTGMKQWVNYLETRTNEKGLVYKEEPDGWCLGDWCTPAGIKIPEPLVNTAYFYHVTDLMGKIAAVLGKTDDQARLAALAAKIRDNFNKAYYDPAKHTYWEGRQGSDVFALAFGLVPEADYGLVFNSLLKHLENIGYHFDTGILATPLLLKVLSDNGRDDIAFRLMDQQDFPGFGYLLDEKNSTLWESWNGDGSHSHPMFGSVVKWFFSGLGGIRPDVQHAGMQHFTIAPKTISSLNYCRSSYISLYGKIRSEWKRTADGTLHILASIPANTSATFVLPSGLKTATDEAGRAIPVSNTEGKSTIRLMPGTVQLVLR